MNIQENIPLIKSNLISIVNKTASLLLDIQAGESLDTNIQKCMELIGHVTNVDRVNLWQSDSDDGVFKFVLKREWLSKKGELCGAIPIGHIISQDVMKEWTGKFSRGEIVKGPVEELSKTEHDLFARYKVRSVILIPLHLRDEVWGIFSIDDCEYERNVDDNDILNVLNTAGLMLMSAVIRTEQEEKLTKSALQLKEMMAAADAANEAKSVFLANMSHEMRTPLNAIIGLSGLVIDGEGLSKEDEENLGKIYDAGSTLLHLVNDILDISKIEAGKFVLAPREYEIPSLINDSITQNILRIGSKPVKLTLDLPEDTPMCLFGDDLRVKQIMSNLLSNAFKYTNEGDVNYSVSCKKAGKLCWLTIVVSDTGTGIDKEHIKNLFTDYVHINKSVKGNVDSTGLGLPITKRLVEMMGGRISVKSEIGKGSVFTVRLKQGFVSDAPVGPEIVRQLQGFNYFADKRDKHAKNRSKRIKLPYARLLIVDDTQTNLDVIKGMLKPFEMQIDFKLRGRDAVEAVREEKVKYTAIFMDHMMPEMDGIEAVRLIREIDTEYARNVPIIAFTANALVGNSDMFLEKGFQAFLPKPIDIKLLDDIIWKWVRDKKLEKECAHKKNGKKRQHKPLSCEGLDIENGIKKFRDDIDTYIDVLKSYVGNTRMILENIKTVNEEKLPDYGIAVHGIKGSSRGVAAYDLAAAAEVMEMAAKRDDYEYIKKNNPEFIKNAYKFIHKAEEMLKRFYYEQPKKFIKKTPDKELLKELLEGCRQYDMDRTDAVISKIKAYEYTDDGGLTAWLKENVELSNFGEIIGKLEKIVKDE